MCKLLKHFPAAPREGRREEKAGGKGGIFGAPAGAGPLSRRPAVDGALIPEPCQPSLWKRRLPAMDSLGKLLYAGWEHPENAEISAQSFPAGASEISSHVSVVLP